MLSWTIEAALKSEKFNRVIVSTDDEEIAELFSYIKSFIQQHKLLNYGTSAYNFYIKGHNFPQLEETNFEVYTDREPKKYFKALSKKRI